MSGVATAASVARLHIVVIAALGTLTFGWLWSGERPWGLAALVGLDWLLVNLLNRVVDLAEDRANRIVGTDLVARRRRWILVGGIATLAASLVLVHLVVPAATPWRIAFHALGFAYNWPLLPGRRRIKALYFWKNTASATGFLLTVFAVPLAASGWSSAAFPPGITWTTVAFAAAFFFLFELSYEVLYDLRDQPGDAAAGIRTYPVVHGQTGAVRIIDGLLGLSAITLVGGYLAGVVPWRLVVMVLAPAAQLALYKRALPRGLTSADCVGITWLGAGLLAAYHAWIALGLPGVGA